MCEVMGIVNVTPDSFSDGGQYFAPEEAVRRVKKLITEGANIIDLGGESTRPEAVPIGWKEEWKRIEPVLEKVTGTVPISIDTYHPETAECALKAGAQIINCVFAEEVPRMVEICAKNHGKLVIPAQSLRTVPSEFKGAVPLWLDPMIGFGTTREEDLSRLKSLPELAKQGRVLVGASRKRIIKKLTGEKMTGKNLGGNIGIAIWCALNGASVVRVHDVLETVQALRVIKQLSAD